MCKHTAFNKIIIETVKKKFSYQPNKKLKRSTLSDANTKRKSEVFRDIASKLINKAGKELKDDSKFNRLRHNKCRWQGF